MSTPCPSLLELTEPAQLPPQLVAHLADCPRCHALRAAWDAEALSDADTLDDIPTGYTWPHSVYAESHATPVRGAIHSVWVRRAVSC